MPLERVALALAAELRPVDAGAVEARLDLIAAELGDLSSVEPTERAWRLIDLLDDRVGFSAAPDRDPERLMLDRVLDERGGHPYALAVVYSAVARRAGVSLFPVGARSKLLLADREAEPTLIIDPFPGGRRLERRIGWLCPHVVALMLIDATERRYRERGDHGRAIRCAELRLQLPLNPAARARHLHELRRARAALN